MRRAILFSSFAHIVAVTLLTLVSLRTSKPDVVNTIYSVRLIQFPEISTLEALDVTKEVRETELMKPMPPVEVKRIKTREKRVDEKEAREVEVVKKTEPLAEKKEIHGVGGLRVEGKEFEYPYYFEIVRRRLQSNFRNPYSRGGGRLLKATIFFQITASGTIINASVELAAGFPAFDRAATRAVLASNPFPELPEEYSGDILGVHCDFMSARE